MADDLLSYLFEKFKSDSTNQLKDKATKLEKERLSNKLAHAEAFVEFAKKVLKDTPPVAFDYMVEGNAVTFSNGDRVRFVPAKTQDEEFVMYQGEIAVTKVNRDSNMQPSQSYKI